MNFTIDGNEFDADRVDQTVRSGTIEEWTITNTSPMDHPIHLHVWPMQVIEERGKLIEQPTWQDVVNVAAHSNVTSSTTLPDAPSTTATSSTTKTKE